MFKVRSRAAIAVTAPKNTLQSRTYHEPASVSSGNLKEQIGEIILKLERPLPMDLRSSLVEQLQRLLTRIDRAPQSHRDPLRRSRMTWEQMKQSRVS